MLSGQKAPVGSDHALTPLIAYLDLGQTRRYFLTWITQGTIPRCVASRMASAGFDILQATGQWLAGWLSRVGEGWIRLSGWCLK
jgi:hypothetical protein